MQKIIPHLWFDKDAEEAVAFYKSVFKNVETLNITHYTEAGHEIHGMEPGTAMTITFQIEGYKFIALNGGPHFKFTPAISFMVCLDSKEEVDAAWAKLSEGGKILMPLDSYPFSERYGWIQDKYGLSWQLSFSTQSGKEKIIPSLLFTQEKAGKAEEAIYFYASVFENSKPGMIARYSVEQAPDKEGAIIYGDVILEGQKFAAMDSAQANDFTFNEAISFLVTCKDQEEIDQLWDKLSAVPESEQCGWVKDKYGVSWQIVSGGMEEMMNDPDKEKANRAMNAMMGMKKIDIAKLRQAYEGN